MRIIGLLSKTLCTLVNQLAILTYSAIGGTDKYHVKDVCSTVMVQVDRLDWMGMDGSLGGVKYRAPHGANDK